MKRTALLAALLILPLTSAKLLADGPPATPTLEQLWEIIQSQQEEINMLRQQQATTEEKATVADEKATVADEKAEAAVVAVEESEIRSASASSWADRTTIGGYGELHYNNLDGSGGKSDKKEIDLHRFVLYFGHEFTDDIRFFSEVEYEHGVAGDDQVGEVEIEQAFVEFDLNDQNTARVGVALLPVGIINETHEPTTFYGVERNPVEKNIIPATWWAGGIGLFGEVAPGWGYDVVLHEGLKIPGPLDTDFDGYKVRGGRQKTGTPKLPQPCSTSLTSPRVKTRRPAAHGSMKYTRILNVARLACAPSMPCGTWMAQDRQVSAQMNRKAFI